MRIYTKTVAVCLSLIVLGGTLGCASLFKARHQPEDDSAATASAPQSGQEAAAPANHEAELKAQVQSLQSKLDAMEGRMAAMTEKMDVISFPKKQSEARGLTHPVGLVSKDVAVAGHPSDHVGVTPDQAQEGMIADAPIAMFREAMVLFSSKKYSEAVLGFSGFLERYADHPFAGSAQYYVAESYYQQGESKLALQEFQRLLTAYDRSSKVPDTLARIATIQTAQGKSADAARARQQLLSLFPNSPAAAQSAQGLSPGAESFAPSEAPVTAPVAAPIAASKEVVPSTQAATEEVALNPKKVVNRKSDLPVSDPGTSFDLPPNMNVPRVPTPTAPVQGNIEGSR